MAPQCDVAWNRWLCYETGREGKSRVKKQDKKDKWEAWRRGWWYKNWSNIPNSTIFKSFKAWRFRTFSKDYLPKPCLLRKKIIKIKIKKTKNKSTQPTKQKNPTITPHSLLKYFPLTASLHQEQLMATISLLWKENFCWKPYNNQGGKRIKFVLTIRNYIIYIFLYIYYIIYI